MAQMVARPTHLTEIVRQEPTHMVFCDVPIIRTGGVCLNPSGLGTGLVWRHPWPPDITSTLISDRNPDRTLTNSNLELSSLVLYKINLLDVCPEAKMAAPCSRLDNTPTVSWSTWETSTTNPVVADLRRIRAIHS